MTNNGLALHFVDKGQTIDSDYYCSKILNLDKKEGILFFFWFYTKYLILKIIVLKVIDFFVEIIGCSSKTEPLAIRQKNPKNGVEKIFVISYQKINGKLTPRISVR